MANKRHQDKLVPAVAHWGKSVGHTEASEAWYKDDVDKLENEEHFVINPDKADSKSCELHNTDGTNMGAIPSKDSLGNLVLPLAVRAVHLAVPLNDRLLHPQDDQVGHLLIIIPIHMGSPITLSTRLGMLLSMRKSRKSATAAAAPRAISALTFRCVKSYLAYFVSNSLALGPYNGLKEE